MLKRKKVKAEKQDESIDVVEDIENLTFWSSSKILLKNKGKFLQSNSSQLNIDWKAFLNCCECSAACKSINNRLLVIDFYHSILTNLRFFLINWSKFSCFHHWEWQWMHLSKQDWWISGQKLLKSGFKLMLQQLL